MNTKIKPQIDLQAVTKAMESVLPAWLKIGSNDSEADAMAREELIHNKLSAAFYKSAYTKQYIDWDYALQLIYWVFEENKFGNASGFAKRLNFAVEDTAKQRDLVLVIPLGFPSQSSILPGETAIRTPLSLGPFRLSPAAPTAKRLNKVLASYGAASVSASDFVHQVRQSHMALGTHPLLTLESHGSIDAIRLQPDPRIRRLIRLIELFARVFRTDESASFSQRPHSQHVFIVNKQKGDLNRIPWPVPLTVSVPLSAALVKILRRPELVAFLELLESGNTKNNLNGRLRNALNFFGRAIDEDDRLTRFLFLVIAMEAIFTRDKNTPIKVTLADYATILCFKEPFRRDVHADLRDIYDVRSGIVHSGLSGVDSTLLLKAEQLAVRAIYCSLDLAVSVKDGDGKPEDRFFTQLNEMKIGISKNNLKLPPWDGYELPEEN